MARLTHYVMDHQRIENELVETKIFYEEIMQNLQSGVLVSDKDDNIYFANQFMFKVAKIPSEKLLGINAINGKGAFPEADLSEFAEKYIQAKQSLSPLFYENIKGVTPGGRKVFQSGWFIPKVQNKTASTMA